MADLIFRNDDVNYNTKMISLYEIYGVIKDFYPRSEIWSGITLFSDKNDRGSVYQEVPFKDRPVEWFYEAKYFMKDIIGPLGKIVSHGLYHVDHSKLDYDAQQMSIVGSCRYLKSNTFIAPFNRWNKHTEKVCSDSGIYFANKEDWRSLEFEEFTPDHKYWYFHCWRLTPEKLKNIFEYRTKNVFNKEHSPILG